MTRLLRLRSRDPQPSLSFIAISHVIYNLIMAQKIVILCKLVNFCKMDIGPALGRKNLFHDFSFPNHTRLTGHVLDSFFKEIVKQISLKNIGPTPILQKFP